jgi:integrase
LGDRITFDQEWTKMGLHHDVPRAHLVDELLEAAKHFQRAAFDYVFPSPKTGGQMSGFTKMVNRLVKEAGVAKFTMHDLRRSLRTNRAARAAAPAARPQRCVSTMKIHSHTESHIVELEDGSRWQVYPGDLDLTLSWKPDYGTDRGAERR